MLRSAATKNLARRLSSHEILRLRSASAQHDTTPHIHIDGLLVISFAFFRGVKMKKTRILWHFYHFSAHRYRATECRKLLYC